jgi:hypothetical protein
LLNTFDVVTFKFMVSGIVVYNGGGQEESPLGCLPLGEREGIMLIILPENRLKEICYFNT